MSSILMNGVLRLPPFMLGTTAVPQNGVGFPIGDFPAATWRDFAIKSSDAPLLPVVGSQYSQNISIVKSASIPWGTPWSVIEMPRAILVDSFTFNTVLQAVADLGEWFLDKHIIVGAPDNDPRASSGLTWGVPWHGQQIISDPVDGNGVEANGISNLPLVFPEKFVGGKVLGLYNGSLIANLGLTVDSLGGLPTTLPNTVAAATAIANDCFPRFSKWSNHYWYFSGGGSPTYDAEAARILGVIIAGLPQTGWFLHNKLPEIADAPPLAEVTEIILDFFGP